MVGKGDKWLRDMKMIKLDRFKEEDGDERELGKGDKWVKGDIQDKVGESQVRKEKRKRENESEVRKR